MRKASGPLAIAAICLALSGCATNVGRPPAPEYFHIYDKRLGFDEPALFAWSEYCDVLQRDMERYFRAEPKGRYAISFEAELEARRALIDAYVVRLEGSVRLGPRFPAYLDELAAIRDAGYLEEYVFRELDPGDWIKPEGLDLDGYDAFMRARLPGHVPRAQATVWKAIRGSDSAGAAADREADMGEWTRDERLTVELSFISLAGFWMRDAEGTARAVADLTGRMLPRQEIAWGPAVHQPAGRPSDALVLVCRDLDDGAYDVVMRGTNPISTMEWMSQDFQVRDQVPWREVRPGPAPAEALVSEGTASAIALRLGMSPVRGAKGEGVRFADALVDILERSDGPCVMRFTGHSLGGLLASAMALWLVDYLEAEGKGGLRDKLRLEVYAYAGPTAGNEAFAGYLESRLSGNLVRRYACDLDVAPIVWDEAAMKRLPELYLPEVRMQALTSSFYGIGMSLARGKGYAQPGAVIAVPSRVVPTRGGVYLLEAAYQHSVPYLDMLLPGRKDTILREVIEPLVSRMSFMGMKPPDLRALYEAWR